MNNEESPREKIKDLFKVKESFHRELAKISFEEKIKILIRLQKITDDIQTSSKKKWRKRIWKIT